MPDRRSLVNLLPVLARLLPVVVGLLALGIQPAPEEATWAGRLGDEHFAASQAGHGLDAYTNALAHLPGSVPLAERLVRAAAAAGQPARAEAILGWLAANDGWTPARLRRMGDLRSALGDAWQATLYWQAALRQTSADASLLRALAAAYVSLEDWPAAVVTLQQLLSLAPDNAQAHYQLALLLAPQDTEMALNHLALAEAAPLLGERARAVAAALAEGRDAEPALAATRLGAALIGLGEWAMAERVLKLAALRDRAYPTALAYLALAQGYQGKDDLPALHEAQALAPDDPLVNYALGLHWRRAGDDPQSLAAFLRAQAADPNNPALAAELGQTYRRLEQPALAEPWLQLAVSLTPGDADFLALLATFYAEDAYDLPGRGLPVLREAARQTPDNADIRASLGWALYLTGDAEGAQTQLEAALEGDPASPRALYYLGALLEFRGDVPGAVSAYRRALQAPDAYGFGQLAAQALERSGG